MRHHPPHDRDTLPWESNDLDRENLEDLYAQCCVRARTKDKNGNLLSKLDVKYGPVRGTGRPRKYAKMMLISQLGYVYEKATGKEPFRGAWDRNRGPFVQLVDDVLAQLGEEGDDTNLIREYLEARDTDSRGMRTS